MTRDELGVGVASGKMDVATFIGKLCGNPAYYTIHSNTDLHDEAHHSPIVVWILGYKFV